DPTKNIITLTNDGAIRWNGRFVNREELRARINAAGAMLLQPQVLLRPEAGTRYELVDSVLADIKRAGTEKLAFVGNEQFSRF
ncbi:MAG: ExbD/TolR family protein, partial [Sphingobium sp.]